MTEKTMWEGGGFSGAQNSFCFGRITKVFPERRTCEVKTFAGNADTDDNSIPECQWINMDAHPDGDESTVIPRVNSFCMVFFVKAEPFVFGFFSPQVSDGAATNYSDEDDGQEVLNEGDRIIKTLKGNKIIVRSTGDVEIEATATNRIILTPDKDLLNILCRNFELDTDGGSTKWYNLNESGPTWYQQVYRDEVGGKAKHMVVEQRGDLGEFISRTEIGSAKNKDEIDQAVWTRTVKNTGEVDFFIRAPGEAEGYKLNIKPDGTFAMNVAGKTKIDIKPTGEMDLNVNEKCKLNIKPSGETHLNVAEKADIKIEPSGKMTINIGPGKVTMIFKEDGSLELETSKEIKFKSPKIIHNEEKSGITTFNSHKGVIDLITNFPCEASTTTYGDV